MKCGIIGLPNVGKSTIFNCLSNLKVNALNYPFCTIEPNVSIIEVPDIRLYKINEFIQSKKIIHATCKIIDIAGLVKDAHKGKGLGNKFLSHIKETKAIIHVLRYFKDENIFHVENNIDPIRDKEIVDTELQIKDIEYLEKYLKNIQNNNLLINQKEIIITKNVIQKSINILNQGKNTRILDLNSNEKKIFNKFNLLTSKPIIYLCNIDLYQKNDNKNFDKIKKIVEQEKSKILIFSAKIHSNNNSDNKKFNLNNKLLINNLIINIYKLLNLISFFTVSSKEIKAWTIKNNTKAIEAASIIHTDIKKGFIRAEVIHYNDYIKYKDKKILKKYGKIFLEGKEYLIQDGDIIYFRFNI